MTLVICTCKDNLVLSGLPGDKKAHDVVTLFWDIKRLEAFQHNLLIC